MSYNAKAPDLSPERRVEMEARFSVTERKNNPPFNPAAEQLERVFSEPDHHAADPQVELLDVSAEGPELHGVRFTRFKPPRVQDTLTRLIYEVGDPRMFLTVAQYLGIYELDYLRSNLPDRRPLPIKKRRSLIARRYTNGELRRELIGRGPRAARRAAALAERERQYRERDWEASLATSGRCVLFHGPEDWQLRGTQWTTESGYKVGGGYRHPGELPDGSEFRRAAAAVPIVYGYTGFRIARRLAKDAHTCYWCKDDAMFDDEGLDLQHFSVMLVSTGGALHLFPTCDGCIEEIGPGPDYYRYSPEDDELRGYPAERHR